LFAPALRMVAAMASSPYDQRMGPVRSRLWLLLPPLLVFALVLAAGCDRDDDPPPDDDATPATNAVGVAPGIQPAEGLTAAEIAQVIAPSIVRVQTEGARIDALGRVAPGGGVGTGVIIDDDGHIVTNNHVIMVGEQPAATITVTLHDERVLDAELVGNDEVTDLAVLQIDADDLTPASFGDPDELIVGQDVIAIGFALDLAGEPSVTRGVISAKQRNIEEPPITIPNAIQTDAGINPGNSGGPLVNARGEMIGINTAIIRGAQNIGFAISVELVEPSVRELIQSGQIRRSFLGVGSVGVTRAIAQAFDLPVDSGLAVTVVQPGGPADQAGIEVDDVIVEVDGTSITSVGELLALLATIEPGTTVEVSFYRDGQQQTVDVTLAERPDS
jgi:serine protease Do